MFDKHIRMVVEHKDVDLYKETFVMYPIMNFLSFMSRSHAVIYNTFANHQHWFQSDEKSQLTIMRVATPKTNFIPHQLWSKYVKKPKIEKDKTHKKEEDWLMTYFEIPRHLAKLYLKDENVLNELKEYMKNN